MKLKYQTYDNLSEFRQILMEVLSAETLEQYGSIIVQTADLGRRYFEEKLGWLLDEKLELNRYVQMLNLVNLANEQLKHQGLNQQSHTKFTQATETMPLCDDSQQLRKKVIEIIEQEAKQIPQGQTLLASSDVIESLFGKYKLFSQRSPLKEVGKLILTIPLSTVELTTNLVKQALETVRNIDVQQWAQQVFGPSMFAKRRGALNPTSGDTEVA